MSAMQFWDEELRTKIDDLQKIIEQVGNMSKSQKSGGLLTAQNACKSLVKNVRATFAMELRTLEDDKLRYEFDLKLTEYDKQIDHLKAKIAWIERDVLMGGAKERERQTMDLEKGRDIMLTETHKVQDKTEESLARTLNTAHEMNEIGAETLVKMGEQSAQIGKITEKISDMDNELKKAELLLSAMLKRIFCDKLILLFVGLVFFSIVGLIIYANVKPDQQEANVPGALVP